MLYFPAALSATLTILPQLYTVCQQLFVFFSFLLKLILFHELPLPCGTVVPMEVASNSRDSYPFLTKRLAVRTNQGIFTYAAIPLTGIPFGFSLWNPYTSGAERNV